MTNPHLNRRRLLALTAASLAASYAGVHAPLARAQPVFPGQPITLYVPFPAGGTTDTLMRALAASASKTLGQPVVIDNKPGAAGTMGANAIVRAPATGYAITLINEPALRLPYLQKTSFDPLKDFTYIIHLTGYTFGVAVRADAPWKQWSDLVTDTKNHPGKITYGTTGTNGTMHLTMEEIAQKLGIEWVHVPFKGEGEIMSALMGGHIDVGCSAGTVGSFVDSGRVRLLVLWNAARSKRWPDVPTLREVGLDIVSTSPFGIAGPKGMDPQVVKTLHDAFKQALTEPATVKLLEQLDMEAAYLDSASYDRFARQRYKSQGELLKQLGLSVQPQS
ncbi:MAG: tripartite tricarboxylate transporter substrate binding protein [Burkholderiaceae bacterium]|jgi:tripartite-type tricarboxylate transporter receptor subunit TctC|nr:tripartite tricarboxylate transporter substrate binding protein [Burkholderiaceae bacterium]